MIQSTIDDKGQVKVVSSLEFDPMWTAEALTKYLNQFHRSDGFPPDRICKPQDFDTIYQCCCNSSGLITVGLDDTAQRLLDNLGPHVTKIVYYGFLVGNRNDLKTLGQIQSPETVLISGMNIPATYLLAAHLIAVAMMDNLQKVANLKMKAAARSLLKRFISASGFVLRDYVHKLHDSIDNSTGVYMRRGYKVGTLVFYYVTPDLYDDMTLSIHPSSLLGSERATSAIKRLTMHLPDNFNRSAVNSDNSHRNRPAA